MAKHDADAKGQHGGHIGSIYKSGHRAEFHKSAHDPFMSKGTDHEHHKFESIQHLASAPPESYECGPESENESCD